jgi:TPR repeat protein
MPLWGIVDFSMVKYALRSMKKFIFALVLLSFCPLSALADPATDYLNYKAHLDQTYIQLLEGQQHGIPIYDAALEQNYFQLLDQYMLGNIATPPASYEQQLAFLESQQLLQFKQAQSPDQPRTALQQQEVAAVESAEKQRDNTALLAGSAAYSKKDYATTLQLWAPLAKQGDAAAELGLGLLYERGQGVPQDNTQAQFWLCQSVKQGNTDAAVAVSTAATGYANPNPDVVSTVYCGR